MSLSRTSFIILYLLLAPAVFFAQQKDVSIRIVQDDEAYLLNDFETRLVLGKQGFKIQVLLSQTEGVYVFASFSDSVYRTGPADLIPGFKDLPNMAMAEEEFNKNKEMIISEEGWSYWFYDPELNWHRFNKKLVFLDSGKVVGDQSAGDEGIRTVHGAILVYAVDAAGQWTREVSATVSVSEHPEAVGRLKPTTFVL